MNKREVKRIFIELLKDFKSGEETIMYNTASDFEAVQKDINKRTKDYLNRMRKALNEGD